MTGGIFHGQKFLNVCAGMRPPHSSLDPPLASHQPREAVFTLHPAT